MVRVFEDFGHEVGEALAEGLRKVWRRVEVPDECFDNRIPWAGLVGLAGANLAFAGGLPLAELTADDVARLSKLSIWEIDKPEPWFESLVATYPDQVALALMPWLERALAMSDSNPILHSVELALKGPRPLKEALLRRALEFLRDGKVVRKELKRTLYRELIDCHLVGKEWVARRAADHLESSTEADTPTLDSEWLAYWATVDFAAVWRWLEEHLTILAPTLAERASLVAAALTETPWANGLSGTDEEIKALVGLFRLLMAAEPQSGEQLRQEPTERSSVQQLRDRIPQIIGNQVGKAAHDALRTLGDELGGTPLGGMVAGLLEEHAVAAAERASRIPSAALPHLGEEYTREPRTEGELFEQVLARLQEVREAVEEGPFSDRVLFSVGMPEKSLQIWLAARLDDTPRRRFIPRFTVTREPQVDDDNRTDIEVSCAAGKVCIEIKPVDAQRSYSATSLVETLEIQLVGQYLKGRNSRHGVLVLLRLDEKRWQLPDGIAAFDDLVDYLSGQAAAIGARSVGVERLEVIGIDCVPKSAG
jgi:hypothetical protein